TINTMAVRLDGSRFSELLDTYGGQRDLQDGVIRVLHDRSFLDDPTRAFRAVRFEQRYGFKIDRDTLALLKAAVKQKVFRDLSSARLLQELRLIFSEPQPWNMME